MDAFYDALFEPLGADADEVSRPMQPECSECLQPPPPSLFSGAGFALGQAASLREAPHALAPRRGCGGGGGGGGGSWEDRSTQVRSGQVRSVGKIDIWGSTSAPVAATDNTPPFPPHHPFPVAAGERAGARLGTCPFAGRGGRAGGLGCRGDGVGLGARGHGRGARALQPHGAQAGGSQYWPRGPRQAQALNTPGRSFLAPFEI